MITPSSRSQVPPELIDQIIDNIRSDERTLAACALVAKSWLPRSRYYLFQNVKLDKSNMESFISILSAPHRTIAPYTRHLELNVSGILGDKMWAVKAARRLRALAAVRSLSLRGVTNLKGFGGQVQKHLIRALPAIEDLEIRYSHLKAFDQLANMVYHCPKLSSLSLHEVEWDDASTDAPLQLEKLPQHWHTLDLSHVDNARVLSWYLAHRASLASFHTVHLNTITAPELPAIGAFLRSLGASLHDLELKFRLDAVVTEAEVEASVDLSPNTGLRTLSLANRGMFVQSPFVGATHVPGLLAQVNPASIEEIELWLYVMRDFHAFRWEGITSLFERPEYERLRRLRVWTLGSMDTDEAAESIRERLAVHEKKELIKFE